MRHTLLLSLLATTSALSQEPRQEPAQAPAPGGSPVTWLADLEVAHELSARDGKPVIAYFTFDT